MTRDKPTGAQIDAAIAYALRHAPITEVQCGESGDFEVEVSEPDSVKDFVLSVLRDLKVIS